MDSPSFGRKLSTAEAAEFLGVGKSWLDKLRLTGGGPKYISYGRRVVYDPCDLQEFAERHKRTSTSAQARGGADARAA